MLGYIYIAFLAAVTVVACIATVVLRLRVRYGSDRYLGEYMSQVVGILLEEDVRPLESHSARQRKALVQAVYTVVSHTYATDMTLLRRAIERSGLERFVARRIALTRGVERARWLLWASAIPLSNNNLHSIMRCVGSGRNIVRSSALMALLSAQPSRAIHIIAMLDYRLSSLDLERVVKLLRRGVMPIAYEPLLMSRNINMQMLGLAIVRSFGIEIAEKHLQNIVNSARDRRLLRETLYTLSSLGQPLGRAKVRRRIEGMTPRERSALCRHLGVEGYSLSALSTLFTEQELSCTEPLIRSYKRDLVCT